MKDIDKRRRKVAVLIAAEKPYAYVAKKIGVSLRTIENDARHLREQGKATPRKKGKPEEEKGKGEVAAAVRGWGEEEGFESAPMDFARCDEIINSDPLAFGAITTLAEAVAGSGYYIECEDEDVRLAVTRFCKDIRLGSKILVMANEMFKYGNSFWERLPNTGGLKWLPPQTMEKSVKRDKLGVIQLYQQRQGRNLLTKFKPDEVLHLKWNVIGNASYGTSILQPVTSTLDTIKSTTRDMKDILAKYSSPLLIHALKNADRKTFNEVESTLSGREAGENILVSFKGAAELTTQVISIDPRARFEGYINQLEDNAIMGLLCPILNFGRGGVRVSDASATAITEVFDRRVSTVQAYMKEIIEEDIIAPFVEKNHSGLDVLKYPTFKFGVAAKPSYSIRELALVLQAILRSNPEALAPNQIMFILSKAGIELPAAEWPTEPKKEPLTTQIKKKLGVGGKPAPETPQAPTSPQSTPKKEEPTVAVQ